MKIMNKVFVMFLYISITLFMIPIESYSQNDFVKNEIINIIKENGGLDDELIKLIKNISINRYDNKNIKNINDNYHVVIEFDSNIINSEFLVFPDKNYVIPRIFPYLGDIFNFDLTRLNKVIVDELDFLSFVELINFITYCNGILNNSMKENICKEISKSMFIKKDEKHDFSILVKTTDLNIKEIQLQDKKKIIFFLSRGFSYNIIKIVFIFDLNNKIINYEYEYLNPNLKNIEL